MGRLTRLVLILAIGTVTGWPIAPRIIGSTGGHDDETLQAVVETWGHLTVLRLQGTPYEMGYQHGVAQRAAIRQWVNEEVYGRTVLGSGQSHGLLLAYAHQLENALTLDIRRELRGIADGAGLSYQDVLILNLVLNRLPPLPLPLPGMPPASPMLNLQALAFAIWPPATHDNALDNTFLGYRLNAPGKANRLRRHLLAIVYQPTNGLTYATLTWCGQVGAWCGLNEANLAICATPAKGGDANVRGLLPAILTRHLLAHARDGEQALRQAIQHDSVAAFQLLIADGQRRSTTAITFSEHRYEMTTRATESHQGVLIFGPNPVQLSSLLNYNLGWLNRDKILTILAASQPLDEKSPGICSKATLLNALFVPGRNELWVGMDLWPASCRRYVRLGLAD